MVKRGRELKMPLLISKVQWMEHYTGEKKVYNPWGKWVGKEKHPPGERFNFQKHKDGNYYAHIPLNGNLRLSRLGAEDSDNIEGVTIVFVAPWPDRDPKGLAVVGYYDDATVYSRPTKLKEKEYKDLQFRASTKNATLIYPSMRRFSYPYRSKSSTFCYGDVENNADDDLLNEYVSGKRLSIRASIQNSAGGEIETGVEIGGLSAVEGKRLDYSLRYERFGSKKIRDLKISSDDDLLCEACGLKHEPGDSEYARARFEVHHKAPVSMLTNNGVRTVGPEDLSVLCSNCHRIIHATRNMRLISNIAAFRKEILGL